VTKYLKLLGFPVLAVILLKTDLDELGRTLARCRPELVAAALGATVAAIAIKAVRWNLMLRAQGHRYPMPRTALVYFAGIYIGVATPGRLGELARVLYVKRDLGIDAGNGLSSIVVDRLMDLYALVAIGLVACLRFEIAGRFSAVFLVLVGALAAAPLLLLNPRIGRWFVRGALGGLARRKFAKVLAEGAEGFFSGIERLASPRLAGSALLTIASYLVLFCAGWLLARSLAIEISFWDAALVLGSANLLALIPVTVAGVGTRDAVFIFAFAALSLSEAEALGFSALVLAVFYLGSGLAGLSCFLAYRPPVEDDLG